MRISKKFLGIGMVLLLLLVGMLLLWYRYGSVTRVALVNFPGFQSTGLVYSNTSRYIKYTQLDEDEVSQFGRYDFVLVFGMGLEWDADQRSQVASMCAKGFPLQVIYATTPDNHYMGVDSITGQRVLEYYESGGRTNYQNLAYYIRREIDGKRWWAPEPAEWEESPTDVYYHLDPSVAMTDVSEFESYLRSHGYYHEGAPRVAVVGGLSDPFGGAKEHLDAVISALVGAGLNVFPIASLMSRMELIEAAAPDLIVYMPHGRLLMGQGDRAVAYLRQRNIPIVTALTLLESAEAWRSNPMGLSGGFLSQTIAMPELDGALYPYALFSQETNAEGFEVVHAMPDRLQGMTALVQRLLKLRSSANADKRVAIFVFRGPGQEAMAAQGLETVPSLYHFLQRLRAEGYDVSGLPSDVEAFRRDLLQRMEAASYSDAVQRSELTSATAVVSRDSLVAWLQSELDPVLQQQLETAYGAAPGSYLVTMDDSGEYALQVPMVRYGHIALIPQPAAAVGGDDFANVHGADAPPPYPYVGAYLWARRAFGADVLLHYGTHGSLEFTPQKQVALGSTDWGDALIGAYPHFYYYTIGNIGESIIAKRRSYAGLVSYLTPPFSESGARGVYSDLQRAIERYYAATSEDALAREAGAVTRLAQQLGVHRELRLDSLPTAIYSAEEIERIDNYAEEIAMEKVNGSLYTAGVPYSPERLQSTVLAMAVEPIAYAKARLDRIVRPDTPDYSKQQRLFGQYYTTPARQLVEGLLRTSIVDSTIVARYAGISLRELQMAHALSPDEGQQRMRRGPRGMPTGQMQGGESHHAHGAAADTVRQEQTQAEQQISSRYTPEWATAVLELERAIYSAVRYQRDLEQSPTLEMDALVNALNGGYTAPSSGGDAVANPNGVPTGRNLYSVNAEATPSAKAWDRGVKLAQQTIEAYQTSHEGAYPTKVSYTFWSSEFIESEGTSIAQVLYMLGVEPVRDSFGRVTDIRLIPSEELGRPRIDVVVQTSGQFRDLAASRLALITRAVAMAAEATDAPDNYVAAGTLQTERALVEAGMSPKEARRRSTHRVFGGINGMYGTGIQEMITAGDKWESEAEIAEVYLNNMGASYADLDEWGSFSQPLFRAALANTDVVVQPRQSNTWGALSLDHVYEFMGGLTLTVRAVTGKDPDTYFSDYRNHNRFRMQELKEAIGVESRSTVLNQAYVQEMMQGGASSIARVAEVVTNTYGWDVAKPEVIDDELWNEMYEIYVADKWSMGVPQRMESVNPQVLQEITGVMLETIRKGMWAAGEERTARLAELHADLAERHGIPLDGMSGTNPKLQDFIAHKVTTPAQQQAYLKALQQEQDAKGMVMKRTEHDMQGGDQQSRPINGIAVAVMSLILIAIAVYVLRRRRRA